MTHQDLIDLLNRVRQCLANNSKRFRMYTLQDFPRGACTWASGFVEYILEEEGYRPLHKGGRRDGCHGVGHEWTLLGATDLDITGDQFADCHEPIIVATSSSFHAQFRYGVTVEPPSIREALADSEALRSDFDMVLNCLKH